MKYKYEYKRSVPMGCNFYAMLSRMKYIDRWGLMNNTRKENISEHSLEVAILAHALVLIGNARFQKKLDAQRAATLALFHDCPEILTGDLPTPVKYGSPQIQKAYREVEQVASQKLLDMLPDDLKEAYTPLFLRQGKEDQLLMQYVKAADKLSALIKCTEEIRMGNLEFEKARQSVVNALEQISMPELDVFMEEMFPAYSLTLDELDTKP